MSRYTDEQIIAFVDGCLPEAERQALEADRAADPELARQIARHGLLRQQIAAAYGPPPADRIDDAMLARLGLAAPAIVDLGEARARRADHRWVGRLAWAGSLAASLAVGLLLGRTALPDTPPVSVDPAGTMVAGPILASALDTHLAGQDGPVRIGLSFRTGAGLCRTFIMAGTGTGLACHEPGRWIVPVLVEDKQRTEAGGDYRLAGGEVPPVVMAEVDRRIVGEPLTPQQEAQARTAGWR